MNNKVCVVPINKNCFELDSVNSSLTFRIKTSFGTRFVRHPLGLTEAQRFRRRYSKLIAALAIFEALIFFLLSFQPNSLYKFGYFQYCTERIASHQSACLAKGFSNQEIQQINLLGEKFITQISEENKLLEQNKLDLAFTLIYSHNSASNTNTNSLNNQFRSSSLNILLFFDIYLNPKKSKKAKSSQ